MDTDKCRVTGCERERVIMNSSCTQHIRNDNGMCAHGVLDSGEVSERGCGFKMALQGEDSLWYCGRHIVRHSNKGEV